MKARRFLSLVAPFCLVALQATQAAGFNTPFNNATYTGGFAAWSGQDGWVTNDPYNVGTDAGEVNFMGYVPGWTPGGSLSGNYSGLLGGVFVDNGYFNGLGNVTVSKAFTPFTPLNTATVNFTIDFGILGSAQVNESYPNEDTFGVTLRNATGTTLLGIKFSPTAAVVGDLRVQWYNGSSIQNGTTSNGALTQNREFGYGSKHRLFIVLSGSTFDAYISDLSANSSNVETNVQQFVNDGLIGNNLNAYSFADLAINWDLANGTLTNNKTLDQGSNYMVVNKVSVVPEPSVSLLVLAALGMRLTRRSRRS